VDKTSRNFHYLGVDARDLSCDSRLGRIDYHILCNRSV
jgi:hypothetical protein